MSITSTLSIAAQALKAQQLAVQTTGHNLANAATPGYSRQRVDLTAAFPSFEGGVWVGRGVDANGVRAIVDRFSEAELLTIHANVGFSEAEHRTLSAIEQAFPTSGGIDTALNNFFGALSDLANNPSGQAERVSLIGKANRLGESLRQTRNVLQSIQANLDKNLEAAGRQLNVLTKQIATLNQQIAFGESTGEPANDFRDQRQVLLQQLSHLTGATVREEKDGQVTVLAGSLLLVSGSRAASVDSSTLGTSGLHVLLFQGPDGLSYDATSLFATGQIGAILKNRDIDIPDAIDRLDLLAKTVVDQVNAQHATGFDLGGAAGGDFFTPVVSVSGAAGLVQVDSAVVGNPRLIAAASTAAGVPGDNRNALSLVNLQNVSVPALGDHTIQEYFLSFLGEVGEQAQTVEGTLDFQNALLTQTQTRREGISGVNIDEEMTKLILFQRAFEASSRLVTTSDEMYQSLIEMVR
jgi:flagellar hook-associated protein 1 FlgK